MYNVIQRNYKTMQYKTVGQFNTMCEAYDMRRDMEYASELDEIALGIPNTYDYYIKEVSA